MERFIKTNKPTMEKKRRKKSLEIKRDKIGQRCWDDIKGSVARGAKQRCDVSGHLGKGVRRSYFLLGQRGVD